RVEPQVITICFNRLLVAVGVFEDLRKLIVEDWLGLQFLEYSHLVFLDGFIALSLLAEGDPQSDVRLERVPPGKSKRLSVFSYRFFDESLMSSKVSEHGLCFYYRAAPAFDDCLNLFFGVLKLLQRD